MARELRIDLGTLRPPTRRADGTLLVEGALTRTGVFVYRDAQGNERREYRPPDEVFRADALESFHLVPLTNDHPAEMLTASNAKRYTVGAVGAPRRDGAHVVAPISVFDAETVAKVESGKQELSCGYSADIVDEPGVSPEGERYDAIQRGITGNHVAIVDVARAGREARIRMDGAAVMVTPVREARADGGNLMDELKKALEQAAAEKARADKAEAERDAEKARADKLEADRDAQKERADKAEKSRTDEAAALPALVRARVDLETKAAPVLGADVKLDAMSDREIRVAVIKAVCDVEVPADKSDEYVSARYDGAIEQASRALGSLVAARSVAAPFLGATRADDVPDEEEAAARMRARSLNAWKTDAEEK